MKTSPLQLDDSYIVEVIVKASDTEVSADFRSSDIRIQADPKYTQSENDPLKWEVELNVLFCGAPEKPSPYSGRAILRGFFTINGGLKEEIQKHIVAVNSPAMLYSTAREIVANLTARGRFGRMLLPSITFIDEKKRFDPPPDASITAEDESKAKQEQVAD